MLDRLLQFLNAEVPILVTLSGITMLASPVHPENAEFPIVVTVLGIVMLVILVHPENAEFPIVVTVLGIVMLVIPVQPENAESPIFVPPVIITVFKDVGTVLNKSLKFAFAKGNVILVRLLQFLNAKSLIV